MSGYYCEWVGIYVSEATVKVDEKGRVMIPKDIREAAELKKGSYVNVKAKGKVVVIEPWEAVADKYYGFFKIAKWPKDVDEFMVEVVGKWWVDRGT